MKMTTPISGGLITLEYAAAGLKYKDVGSTSSPDNTARDADLTAYVQAATPAIEDIIGSALSASKVITFDGGVPSVALNDRVQSVTSVVEAGRTLTAGTDYVYDSRHAVIHRGLTPYSGCFAYGWQNVAVTYVAGYASVPQNVQLAARELVRFWIQQGNESQRPAYADGVESASVSMGFLVPKRVQELLDSEQIQVGFA